MPPNEREGRPGDPTGASSQASTPIKTDAIIVSRADNALPPSVVARRRWAYRMFARVDTPPPKYGSAEWLALPNGDYAKIAGVVYAAECWARDSDELPERLALEVEASRAAFLADEEADYQARAEAHRREWSHLSRSRGLSFVERRAEQLASIAPELVRSTGKKVTGS